jgi:hypothetical protein
MTFDIKAITDQMLQAVKDTVKGDWSKIQDSATGFISDHQDRLEMLGNQRLHNEIDDDFLQKRIKDEESLFQAELDATEIISKTIAQEAANAALDVLSKAISTAVGSLL